MVCAVPAGRQAARWLLFCWQRGSPAALLTAYTTSATCAGACPLPASVGRRQLPDRPGAAVLHRGRLLRQGPRRGHHQDRAARRPHRLHLRGDRRGVRRARLPGDPRACSAWWRSGCSRAMSTAPTPSPRWPPRASSCCLRLQAIINMAVNVGLVPAKGITLPFISNGGSSMLAVGLTMGMLLAVTRRRPDPARVKKPGFVSRPAT